MSRNIMHYVSMAILLLTKSLWNSVLMDPTDTFFPVENKC